MLGFGSHIHQIDMRSQSLINKISFLIDKTSYVQAECSSFLTLTKERFTVRDQEHGRPLQLPPCISMVDSSLEA